VQQPIRQTTLVVVTPQMHRHQNGKNPWLQPIAHVPHTKPPTLITKEKMTMTKRDYKRHWERLTEKERDRERMEGTKILSVTQKMKANKFLEPKTYFIFRFGCLGTVLN